MTDAEWQQMMQQACENNRGFADHSGIYPQTLPSTMCGAIESHSFSICQPSVTTCTPFDATTRYGERKKKSEAPTLSSTLGQSSQSRRIGSAAGSTDSSTYQLTQAQQAVQALPAQALPASPELKRSKPFIIEIDSDPIPTFIISPADPGIYLQTAPSNVCGAIASYNFSEGPNPQLTNVTTCTSLDTGTTRYADGMKRKSK